jgi:hypothetical protein
MSFTDRTNALIDLLEALDGSQLQYVLVGGYAVSSFNTRFSTDLDVVVSPEDTDAFTTFLETREFEQIDSHEKTWFYDCEVIEYEKRLAPQQPIGFDLLVNGLGCRQTTAQWSFEYLTQHCTESKVSGGTTSTTAQVIDGAVLVAAKLHSGRETDLRDVVAVTGEIDLDTVTPHLYRGDENALCEQLQQDRVMLESDDLKHGYRSDFGASAVSKKSTDQLRSYLSTQIERLSE